MNQRAKHLLIVPSEEFVPAESHLAGIFQLHQARALVDAGYKVGVLSMRLRLSPLMIARAALYRLVGRNPGNELDNKSIGELASVFVSKIARPHAFITHEEVEGIPVVRAEGFYFLRPSPATDHIGWIRAGVAAFDEYASKHGKPDLIHAHNLDPAGLLALRLSKVRGVPYVVTEHSTFYERDLIPKNVLPMLREAAAGASAFATVSPQLGATLERKGVIAARGTRWVPNVIDPFVVNAPTEPRKPKSCFDFLCVGNLIPVKNHAVLLDAFHRAFGDVENVHLRIGGDGPLEADLRRQAETLALTSKVKFLGRLSREQVVREIDKCDALVLPSRVETFGVVLIEALVRGKPVIATECGGPESFIEPADGIIIPRDDVNALAEAMIDVKARAPDFDQGVLRTRAIDRFGEKALVRSLAAMYETAVSANA